MELYIENKRVELSSDICIQLNYSVTNLNCPTDIKNTYSKTITIDGTPTNNELFGDIFKMDRQLLNGGNIGIEFDARKRANYILLDNACIVERGYIQLNDIILNNNVVKYNITLYSLLGDFFYNLAYDEQGNQKTLANMYYAFNDLSEDEETADRVLFELNKDYVKGSWDKLNRSTFDSSDTSIDRWVSFAPTYNGNAENFSNNKVLVNVASGFPRNTSAISIRQKYFPNSLTDGGKTYNLHDSGFALVEADRDMNEFEVGDLRSVNMRPCVKFSKIFDAIANPKNNGGYSVELDADIQNTEYYNSYVIFDRIEFEKETDNLTTPLHYDTISITNTDATINKFNTDAIDTSRNINSNAEFNFGFTLQPNGVVDENAIYLSSKESSTIVGGFLIKLISFDSGGNKYAETPNYFITTDCLMSEGHGKKKRSKVVPIENLTYDWSSVIKSYYHLNDIQVVKTNVSQIGHTNIYHTTESVQMNVALPNENGCYVQIVVQNLVADTEKSSGMIGGIARMFYFDSKDLKIKQNLWSSVIFEEDANKQNGYYDGSQSVSVQHSNVTKQLLFGSKYTALDYLLGFSKLFNLRFMVDMPMKKVRLVPINHYYIDEVVDINESIDYSQQFKIRPTLVDSKWYVFGLDTPDSYSNYLYSKKFAEQYGEKRFDTQYSFNKEEKNLFDGNVFKNTSDYLISSQLFNIEHCSSANDMHDIVPSCCLPNSYKYRLYDSNGESKDFELYGVLNTKVLYPKFDDYHKICCFDKDNKNLSDITATFAFYNYNYKPSKPFILSDNLPIMNDIDEQPCYLYTQSEFDADGNRIAIPLTHIPFFSRYRIANSVTNIISDSFDMAKPKALFIQKNFNYDESATIYNQYWKYIEDMYSSDVKAVECYVVLKEQPQVAMRKFYHFDNSLFIINSISDYSPNAPQKPIKVEFVRVIDKNAYLSKNYHTIQQIG